MTGGSELLNQTGQSPRSARAADAGIGPSPGLQKAKIKPRGEVQIVQRAEQDRERYAHIGGAPGSARITE